ncbi:MAG: hypothetical protein AAFQ63_12135 [Cyanobacteria bacterium J06621_11]
MPSRLLKTSPLRLPPQQPTLGADFQLIHSYRTFYQGGHRLPFLFPAATTSIDIILKLRSDAAARAGWVRAGVFAQVLDIDSLDPVAWTVKAYWGENFHRIEGLNQPFFLDFWAYRWVADYELQLFAKE